MGIATFVGDGATTTATVNWIDGVQKIFQRPVVVIPVLSVTAPATLGGVANQAVYSALVRLVSLARDRLYLCRLL